MGCSCTTHKPTHTRTHNPTCNKARTGSTAHAVGCAVVGGNLSQRQVNCSCKAARKSQQTNSPSFPQPCQPPLSRPHTEGQACSEGGLQALYTQYTHNTHDTQQAAQASAASECDLRREIKLLLQAARRHAVATHNAPGTQPAGSTRVRRPSVAAAHVHTHIALVQAQHTCQMLRQHDLIKTPASATAHDHRLCACGGRRWSVSHHE